MEIGIKFTKGPTPSIYRIISTLRKITSYNMRICFRLSYLLMEEGSVQFTIDEFDQFTIDELEKIGMDLI